MHPASLHRPSALVGAALVLSTFLLVGFQAIEWHRLPPGCADPRTPIDSLPFTIDECGSYVVTGCLTGVSGSDGILIDADHVTLDLNGFTLTGVPGSLDGIRLASGRKNAAVRNGAVLHWGGDGIDLNGLIGRVEGVRASFNGTRGIQIAHDALVRRCEVEGNAFQGIQVTSVGGRILIDSCIAKGNSGGISPNSAGGIVSNCTATGNDFGIAAGNGGGWLIRDNACSANLDGINMCGANLILRNTVTGHQNAGAAPGITVRCGGNYVRENLTARNDIGIQDTGGAGSDPDVVVRNSSNGDALSYSAAAPSDFGPVGSAATSTSPWANIEN